MLQAVVRAVFALTDDLAVWCVTVLAYNVQQDNIADFILDIASNKKNYPMIRSLMKPDWRFRRLHATVPRHASAGPMLTTEKTFLMEEHRSLDTP